LFRVGTSGIEHSLIGIEVVEPGESRYSHVYRKEPQAVLECCHQSGGSLSATTFSQAGFPPNNQEQEF